MHVGILCLQRLFSGKFSSTSNPRFLIGRLEVSTSSLSHLSNANVGPTVSKWLPKNACPMRLPSMSLKREGGGEGRRCGMIIRPACKSVRFRPLSLPGRNVISHTYDHMLKKSQCKWKLDV